MSSPQLGATNAQPPAVPAETSKTTLRAQVYANYQNTENKVYKFAKMIFLAISYPIAALLDGFIGIANWFTTQKPEETPEKPAAKPGRIARYIAPVKEFYGAHSTAINRTAGVTAGLGISYFTGFAGWAASFIF